MYYFSTAQTLKEVRHFLQHDAVITHSEAFKCKTAEIFKI